MDEIFSVLKKWEKCMVQAVGMIGKNENSNVRREKWLSLLRCIHSFTQAMPHLFFFFFGGGGGVILEPNCLSFFGQLGRMLVSNSSCNSNRKILGLLQFPLKWKLLLHSQIRSRGRCWSLVFLLKVVPPRCAQSLSLSLSLSLSPFWYPIWF